jgi:hypothetical protein
MVDLLQRWVQEAACDQLAEGQQKLLTLGRGQMGPEAAGRNRRRGIRRWGGNCRTRTSDMPALPAEQPGVPGTNGPVPATPGWRF